MNEKDIIKEAMKTCGWNQETLAEKLGYKTQSCVSNRLAGKSMRVDTFVKMLSAMGYEVVVKSISPKINKNTWKIDSPLFTNISELPDETSSESNEDEEQSPPNI